MSPPLRSHPVAPGHQVRTPSVPMLEQNRPIPPERLDKLNRTNPNLSNSYPATIYESQHQGGRPGQQDQTFVFADPTGRYKIYGVADGIGGHLGGDIASLCAKETLRRFAQERLFNEIDRIISETQNIEQLRRNLSSVEWTPEQHKFFDVAIAEMLKKVVHHIENTIRNTVEELKSQLVSEKEFEKAENIQSMGTTLTACFEIGRKAYIVHVGDSRAYLVGKNETRLITRDHSHMWELMYEEKLTYEEALDRLRIRTENRYKSSLYHFERKFGKEARQEWVEKKAQRQLNSGIFNYVDRHKLEDSDIDIQIIELDEDDRIILVTDGFLQALSPSNRYGNRTMEREVSKRFRKYPSANFAHGAILDALENYEKAKKGSLKDLDNLSVVARLHGQ